MSEVTQNKIGQLNYLRFEPSNFSEDKKYPVIIHFHGAGSRGDNVEVLNDQAIMRYANDTENFPFVMFLPQCNADCWFELLEQLREFVKNVVELPYVDKSNVYLSGVSMGGYASWQMLMSEPDIFRKAYTNCPKYHDGSLKFGAVPFAHWNRHNFLPAAKRPQQSKQPPVRKGSPESLFPEKRLRKYKFWLARVKPPPGTCPNSIPQKPGKVYKNFSPICAESFS